MLPYTPLHYMLIKELPGETKPKNSNKQLSVLVMTSGNVSEEPIAMKNREARTRLATLADAFLMHDRPIFTRCDDSVVRVFLNPDEPSSKKNADNATYPLRRSRGYAPFPVHLSWNSPPLTAVGGELKNTFCITRDRYAFLSQHIGDLENFETLNSFEKSVRHYERLFRIQPEIIAHDLHPDYLATRYAIERSEKEDIPSIGIQHHHAHIAACMAEHELEDEKPVIGVVFDGTGYGTDGAIWGGEFLLSKYSTYQRVAHLQYVPLPGGDTAIRKPARIALAYLWQAGIEWNLDLASVNALRAEERQVLRIQLEQRINSPNTSSMGRLFDAIASLIGIRQVVNYEAQAAIELEANVEPSEESSYRFELTSSTELMTIDPTPIIYSVIDDIRAGFTPAIISARFHNSVASMVLEVCTRVRTDFGCSRVVLSGGVWQNVVLLSKTYQMLGKSGFQIHIHRQVPSNDGGIALGQAVITARTIT
jgi:hydrogenase maturation protein HypF